jgi:hypothetical protein
MKKTLLTTMGALALGMSATVQAAPLSGTHVTKPATIAQTAAYRTCWWHDGRRVCRYAYGYRDHGWRHHHWWRWRHHHRDRY